MRKPNAAAVLALSLSAALFSAAVAGVRAEDPNPTFTLENYSLFVDGVPLAERVGTLSGRGLWFSLPGQGQFILSPEPHEGFRFEKIAEVRGNTISFSRGGKFYRIVSESVIVGDGSGTELWVAHDAEFQPKGCGGGFCAGSASSFEYFLRHREREVAACPARVFSSP